MLCSVTPTTTSVLSIIINAKHFSRFDKYFVNESSGSSGSHYLNNFIEDLDLSAESAKVVEKSLNDISRMKFYGNNIFDRRNLNNIELLIKRNYNTRNTVRHTAELGKDANAKLEGLLEKYKSNPLIQKSLIDAYRIGGNSSCDEMKNQVKVGKRRMWFTLVMVVIFTMAMVNTYMNSNSVNNTSVAGGIAKMLTKTWTQSGASLVTRVDVKFDDVQGCDEVKKELQDVVNFLKNPTAFTEMGAKLPKGVLLVGEPGIGKTLLARAVAGEAGVPFLYVSGSQFDEMFVGVGASRVRALFSEAKEHSPCVVFIDELDAVCGERTSSPSHPYANQTINQLLSEMDGFVENEGIVIIGATNRMKALDKAVLRPGRFDVKVHVHRPDYRGRVALFELYLSKVVMDGNIDVASLARSTTGYTGADVKNMVNQAAIICVLKDHEAVSMSHLWEAQTKMTLGAARNRPLQEAENRLTAYHEAGHTIVTVFSPNSSNKVKLVTILPRGESGGHNSFVPKIESSYYSKAQLKSMIDALMGGRAAEELLGGPDQISTGVSSDMEKATRIARQMVKQYTMSEEVGLQVYSTDDCQCGGSSKSPKVAETIDIEVNKLLKESHERARLILQEHGKEWHALAAGLLKYETLEGDDIDLVMNGKSPKVAVSTEAPVDKGKSISISSGTRRLLNMFGGKDSGKK